jgi:hypothetical protein
MRAVGAWVDSQYHSVLRWCDYDGAYIFEVEDYRTDGLIRATRYCSDAQ